mgnify:FL=1
MKVINSYIFEKGDKLYYVNQEGNIIPFELTNELLNLDLSSGYMPVSFGEERYVFKPYEPVRIYDDFERLYLWKAEGNWTGSGMGSSFNVKYTNEVANVFINEKRACHYGEVVKKQNKEREFFNSYSRINIKHAKSNRLLNSLSFSKYSLIELLKLNNLYQEEGTPIKVTVLDKENNEYDYSEIQEKLKDFI